MLTFHCQCHFISDVERALGTQCFQDISSQSRSVEILYKKEGHDDDEVHTSVYFPFSPDVRFQQ